MTEQIEKTLSELPDDLILWVNPFERGSAQRVCLVADLKSIAAELREYQGVDGRCSVGHNKKFTYELLGQTGCVACERDQLHLVLSKIRTVTFEGDDRTLTFDGVYRWRRREDERVVGEGYGTVVEAFESKEGKDEQLTRIES